MSASPLSADTTVSDALQRNAAVQGVLLAWRTACVGCYMARFCTLKDTATAYGLPWEAFIRELSSVAPERKSGIGGKRA
jgi:hypothetical protein